MKNTVVCSFILLASCVAAVRATAMPNWYATLNTEAYQAGDISPSTAHAAGYTAYYCTTATAADLFDGANTVDGITAYFNSYFATGKSAIEKNGEGMNNSAYFAGGQYSFSSAEYETALAAGDYIAVAFYGEEAFRVFANDVYNTESGHVVFDDAVSGTVGEWTKAVPEPTGGLLILFGLAGLMLKRKPVVAKEE